MASRESSSTKSDPFSNRNKSSAGNIQTVRLSDRYSVAANWFNDTVWLHIRDVRRDKSVSLPAKEFGLLFTRKKELINCVQRVKNSGMKGKRKSNACAEAGSKHRKRGGRAVSGNVSEDSSCDDKEFLKHDDEETDECDEFQ